MQGSKSSILQKTSQLFKDGFYSTGGVYETPMLYSPILSSLCDCNVYLKCENLQTTGSFKIRGATSALVNLPETLKEAGILTASSGNHGAAAATAAKVMGVPVTIYVPEKVSDKKEKKIRSLGASLMKVDGSNSDAELVALSDAKKSGATYISPYNHEDIIAGQGTIGLEILAQKPDVDAVIVSVGGGGLISGIGLNIKANKADTTIIGAFPENAIAMKACMEAGKVIEVPETETLSDGTAGGIEPGSITLTHCMDVIDRNETVSELDIAQAMKLIKEHHGMILEGAAGVAVASLIKYQQNYQGKNVCIVLCGANVTDKVFEKAMAMVE